MRKEGRVFWVSKLDTVAALADAYFVAAELGTHVAGNARPKRLSTINEEKRVYEKLIKKRFGDIAVTDIRRAEIQDFVDRQSKKAKGTGRQCRDIITSFSAMPSAKA
jgi:hypothetical protein